MSARLENNQSICRIFYSLLYVLLNCTWKWLWSSRLSMGLCENLTIFIDIETRQSEAFGIVYFECRTKEYNLWKGCLFGKNTWLWIHNSSNVEIHQVPISHASPVGNRSISCWWFILFSSRSSIETNDTLLSKILLSKFIRIRRMSYPSTRSKNFLCFSANTELWGNCVS